MSVEPVTLRRVPVRMYLPPGCQKVTPVISITREWESDSTQWILEYIRRGDTFVDVGAHVGYYTLIAAKVVGDEGRVFAFEPDPTNFSILERNVRLNGFANVTIERKAVSDSSGERNLYLSTKNSGDHRLCQTDEKRAAVGVETVALDEYFRGKARRVDFVKVDTQGAELLVLAGMRTTLHMNPRARLLLEFWPHGLVGLGGTGSRLLSLLDELGYSVGKVERRRLLATFTPANRKHCNLMLERRDVQWAA